MTSRATRATNDERQGAVRRRTLARLDGVFALMPITGAFFPMLYRVTPLGSCTGSWGVGAQSPVLVILPGAHGRGLAAGWLEDRGQTLCLHRCRSRFSSARRHPGADQQSGTGSQKYSTSPRPCRRRRNRPRRSSRHQVMSAMVQLSPDGRHKASRGQS
jgi:hypothetical protein